MKRIQLHGISTAMIMTLFIVAVPIALAPPASGLLQLAPGPMIAPGCLAALPLRCADGQCAVACRSGPADPRTRW